MNLVATNDVTVTNNVNVNSNTGGSNSSSHTSITTTTNGKTFRLESNEPGEIRVETKNGETTVQTSPGMKVNVTEGEAKVERATKSAEKILEKNKELKKKIKLNIWQHIEIRLKSFLDKFNF